jgi:polyhydroxyalkanoic acid synthase PhaR subunit
VSDSGKQPGPFPDPMQFWRDFYQQSEAAWGKALEQNMGTEAYAAMIGQTLDAYATFQRTLRDSMNRYLETMNLPSRDDFTRLAAQVVALEAKIDNLDEKLDDLQDRLGSRDHKLDRLLERLDAGEPPPGRPASGSTRKNA